MDWDTLVFRSNAICPDIYCRTRDEYLSASAASKSGGSAFNYQALLDGMKPGSLLENLQGNGVLIAL